jgi:hypothetical protein
MHLTLRDFGRLFGRDGDFEDSQERENGRLRRSRAVPYRR